MCKNGKLARGMQAPSSAVINVGAARNAMVQLAEEKLRVPVERVAGMLLFVILIC